MMRLNYYIAFVAIIFLLGCKERTIDNSSIIESVRTTDTIVSKNNVTDLDNVSEDCIESVFKIIRSSEEFQKLTNGLEQDILDNGGLGYGFTVHVSPNPKMDDALEKGDFYEISLHENYPDHMTNIAFYRFDRHQQKLFLMNSASAEYEEIGFDEKLIDDFKTICSE